jgi:hypothetical protein
MGLESCKTSPADVFPVFSFAPLAGGEEIWTGVFETWSQSMKFATEHYLKDSEVVTRNIAGDTIIVPVRGRVGDLDSIYTLNELGTRIWQLIDGMASVSDIVKTLLEEYDVESPEAEKDVLAFLGSLEASGLIRAALKSVPGGL